MKITINYSTYPYRTRQAVKGGLILFTLAALGFLFYTVRQVQLNQAEISQYEKGIHRIDLEIESRRSLKPVAAEPKKLDKKVKLVSEIILKKSFSWTEFLNDLEKAIPGNISIKKIEPRFLDHSVNLSGEALTLKDLTRLILSLEGKPHFNNIFLLDQKVARENRIDFLIHLNYKEKEPNELSAAPAL